MGSLMQRVKEKGLTRRTFIQGSALAAAALALQGCSNSNLQTTTETDPVTEGEWKSVACWAHCGGRCALKAYMVDGICIRLKTDDTHEDSPENPLRKACARGRSRRMDVFGPTRLRYPMKRKNWQPGGGENSQGHLRGIDEWERITWEEALDLVAEETMRIIDTYGNSALLSSSRGDGPRAWSEESRMDVEDYSFGETLDGMLYLIGGCTTNYSTMSQGAWYTSGLLYGYDFWKTGNDRIDARNCEYVVAVGINPAVTAEGQVMYSTLYPIQEAGAKFYFIDPMFTDTAAGIGGEWVPIRPATDKALLLAMAYVMFYLVFPEITAKI